MLNKDGDGSTVETDDGPVPVDDVTAETIACDCGCIDPRKADAEADRRVPVALRRRVLARDGLRCRCCGSRHSKQIHHIIPVSEGGLTVYENLITLCRTCHSLIHAEMLFIEGNCDSGWRFLDSEGWDLHGPGPSPAQAIGAMVEENQALTIRVPTEFERKASQEVVTLAGAPDPIDAEWWRRHGHLLSFNDRRSMFELRPGLPAPAAEGQPGVGTMCQPRPTATLTDLVGQDAVVSSLALAVKGRDVAERAPHAIRGGCALKKKALGPYTSLLYRVTSPP